MAKSIAAKVLAAALAALFSGCAACNCDHAKLERLAAFEQQMAEAGISKDTLKKLVKLCESIELNGSCMQVTNGTLVITWPTLQ